MEQWATRVVALLAVNKLTASQFAVSRGHVRCCHISIRTAGLSNCPLLPKSVKARSVKPRYECIWYYRGVAKDYPNCCHNVLRRDLQCLYAFEALAAISLSLFSTYSGERKHLRCHYKKSKNLCQIIGKSQVHPASIKLTGANGLWYRTTKKKLTVVKNLSKMKYTKSHIRSQLSDCHLNDILLLSTSSIDPDILS